MKYPILSESDVDILERDNIVLSDIGMIRREKEIPKFIFDRNRAFYAGISIKTPSVAELFFKTFRGVPKGVINASRLLKTLGL